MRDRRFQIAILEKEVAEIGQRGSVLRHCLERALEIGAREVALLQTNARNAALVQQESSFF